MNADIPVSEGLGLLARADAARQIAADLLEENEQLQQEALKQMNAMVTLVADLYRSVPVWPRIIYPRSRSGS